MIDQTLLTQIQSAVIEPRDGGASWPSGLWTGQEVRQACDHRQRQVLKETQCVLTTAVLPCLAGQTRIVLPVDWLRTWEVVYTSTTGIISHLQRSDAFETDHAIPDWVTDRDQPQVYMEYDTPTLQMQIAPAPLVAGTLTLLYAAVGAALTGEGTTIAIPDLLVHALKYGALAEMLGKDGRAHDAARAQYAEDRFRLALDVTQILLQGWA